MRITTRHTHVAAPLAVTALALLLLAGCSTAAVDTDGDDTPPVTEPAPPEAERPEGLDAALPVPPGVLLSATPEASAWEYIYGEVTSEEARAFADGFEAAGYDLKVTVDSNGVEQWYFQNADWAVKLEQTHDAEQLRYWVDPIIE